MKKLNELGKAFKADKKAIKFVIKSLKAKPVYTLVDVVEEIQETEICGISGKVQESQCKWVYYILKDEQDNEQRVAGDSRMAHYLVEVIG